MNDGVLSMIASEFPFSNAAGSAMTRRISSALDLH